MYQEPSVDDHHEHLPIAANNTFEYEEQRQMPVEPQTPESEKNSLVDFEN
jgi:hypothetical protein